MSHLLIETMKLPVYLAEVHIRMSVNLVQSEY